MYTGSINEELLIILVGAIHMMEYTSLKMYYLVLSALFALMFRPFGTLTLLSTLMCEVVKVLMSTYPEEETWSWEARDILLDTWTALLVVCI